LLDTPLCHNLFGHEAFNTPDKKGCFTGVFKDCFAHSEQAFLNFLENPSPFHVAFSKKFDIRQATHFNVNLFSYRDICRYCRGTFSHLHSTQQLKRILIDFYQSLPELMNTHWEQCKAAQRIVSFGDKEGTKEALYFPEVEAMDVSLDNVYAYSMSRIEDNSRGIFKKEE
jgi:hypothetical protein